MVGGGGMEIQSIIDDKLEVRFPIRLRESVEYAIVDLLTGHTILTAVPLFEDAFTSWGKEQVARLVGNIGSQYPINEVRVRVNGSWATLPSTNSIENGSLKVMTDGTFTTAGTYDLVAGGNSSYTGANHNEISTNIPLESGQGLVLTIYYGFSGLNAAGNTVTAGRLGGISGYYPVGTVSVDINGSEDKRDAVNAVYNNTLDVENDAPYTSPGTYTSFAAVCTDAAGTYYHIFSGHTIVLQSNQELKAHLVFVYG